MVVVLSHLLQILILSEEPDAMAESSPLKHTALRDKADVSKKYFLNAVKFYLMSVRCPGAAMVWRRVWPGGVVSMLSMYS